MITIVSFIYTNHAVEKMDALGITRKEVEEVVKKGMKWKEEKRRKIWHSCMSSIEVVFTKQDNKMLIITVYYTRR